MQSIDSVVLLDRPDEMSDETKIGRELTMIMLMKRKPNGFGAIPTKRRKDRKPGKVRIYE